MGRLSQQSGGNQLTPRELEILRLMAEGLSNKSIAERLFIGFETVKWYLKQIYSKLQVSSRTQAIAVAHSSGLLEGISPITDPSTPPPNNLPPQPTPFIGRARELAQLGEQLADTECRLLTLIGPGGIGKTRLALEVAARQVQRFKDGVYFVSLAPLTDPNLIVSTIAEAVHFAFAPVESPERQLLNYLRDKHLLLLLDNFEHLLSGIALIPELLIAAPQMKVLVTSRERLQLQSEVVFRVEGFDIRDWTTPEEAAESSAGTLFLQSARRIQPSFELTPDVVDGLSALCWLVRGMPLGILLAASWIDTLSVAEIVEEIQRSFDFLEGEMRDLPERQRSLRAVFEHSWKLLGETERAAMRCFSIFQGGFTREAAQQVAEVSLKTLTSLMNKSFLSRDPSGRFDVHELLRQYAERELNQIPREREHVQSRHAAYYTEFIENRWFSIRNAKEKTTADEIDVEIDNVRAAWNIILEQAHLPQIAMTGRVLWVYLDLHRARRIEGINMFERAVGTLRTLARSEARDLALGEMLQYLGEFNNLKGAPAIGKAIAEEAVALLQSHDVVETKIRGYYPLCLAEFLLGKHQEMRQHAQQAMILAQRTTDPWHLWIPSYWMGLALLLEGNYEEAYQSGKEALHFSEMAESTHLQGESSGILLARSAVGTKRYQEAKAYYLRGLACFEDINQPFYVALLTVELSEVHAFLNEYSDARHTYQRSLSYSTKVGPMFLLLSALRSAATLCEMQGNYMRAVELLVRMLNHPDALSPDVPLAKIALDRLRANLSTADFAAASERGKALNLDAVVADLLRDL
jgi:predicted ATPase/DNA-binding CsgD family transcriptional regulator